MSFPQRTIGELLQDGVIVAIQDGNHGEKHPKASDYVEEGGVPFVMARDFPNGDLDLRNATLLDRQVAARLRIGFARPGDVLLTHKGTVGATGIVPDDYEYVMLTPQVTYYRVDPKRLLNTFLRAVFRSREFQVQLDSFSAQSTRPFVSISAQRALQVPLPSLADQRRIAGILSAYDDLIDNCERRIRVLDEMARSLYREWFVHFRYSGHERVPMVESELGLIPRGWVIAAIDDLAQDLRRSVPKGRLDEGGARYVGLEHIPRRSLALDRWDEVVELGSNKLRFERGDVLFGKIRPYFHKVAVAPFDGVCSADTLVLRAKQPGFRAFVTCLLSSDDFVEYASATSNGSKMPRASWHVLAAQRVAVPPPDVLRRFDSFLGSCLEDMQLLVFEHRNLRTTRELLLPRLLSDGNH